MFSSFFLRSFRILLLPFALLYGLGVILRNWLYDKNILKSVSFGLPVICVGNLSVGGTGKSPMVEWLVENLGDKFHVATLSRGYKRKTRGYALANENTTALEIGDEPMQFHRKFPGVAVAVGEERIEAIPQLLHDRPETEAIILDDAFQHRAIKAGLNILLTEQGNLFTRDFFLPTGDLRDQKKSFRRAGIIVVTKCKPGISLEERDRITREIGPKNDQKIFFTAIEYGQPYHLVDKKPYTWDEKTEILLVTGIANPRPIKKLLEEHSNSYHMIQYRDHHIFSIDDLAEIRTKLGAIETSNKIVLTTEKDAVRLEKFRDALSGLPIFVIPIRHQFLFDGEDEFRSTIIRFIDEFKKGKNN